MKIIKTDSAIKIYYYLAAIDGSVQVEENDTLLKLGREIDPGHFDEYKEELISLCQCNVNNALEASDSYDILSELIDNELHNQTNDPAQGVTSRMLIWNMLVLSMANGEYDTDESRLIRHIVRLCEIEESIFLEMEQIIQTFAAVDNELKELQKSTLPYSEIRPLAEELEKRKANLNKQAAQLVADEMVAPVEAYIAKEDVVDKARSAYLKATDPILGKVRSSMGSAFDKVKEKAAPATDSMKQGIGKAWTGIKGKFGKSEDKPNPSAANYSYVQPIPTVVNRIDGNSSVNSATVNGNNGVIIQPKSNYCACCGTKRENGARFCCNCGTKFD